VQNSTSGTTRFIAGLAIVIAAGGAGFYLYKSSHPGEAQLTAATAPVAASAAIPDSSAGPLPQETALAQGKVPDTLPDIVLADVHGKPTKLSSFGGRPLMLNFWATWCAPCLMEFYDFPGMVIKPFADKPFALLPIAKSESKETVLAKMKQLARDGIQFPVGWDTDDAIWKQMGGYGIPRTILIDKKGVVRYVSTGGGDANLAALVQEITRLVNE